MNLFITTTDHSPDYTTASIGWKLIRDVLCQLYTLAINRHGTRLVVHTYAHVKSAAMAENTEPVAQRAAEQALKKLTDHLTCPVCLEAYHNPRVLSCFHVLCEKCVDRLVHVGGRATSLDCPTCRQRTELPQNDTSSLPFAFHMDYLFEIQDTLKQAKLSGTRQCESCENAYAASTCSYCRDCSQVLCARCTADHQSINDHQIESIDVHSDSQVDGKNTRSLKCPKHDKILDHFCTTCDELVCCECMLCSHKDGNHQCSLVAGAYPQQKEAMVLCSRLLGQQQGVVERVVKSIDIGFRQVENQHTATQADINQTIQQLQEALEERKLELIGQLDRLTQQKKRSLAAQRDEFELVQTQLHSCLDFVNKTLMSSSQEELLAAKQPAMKHIEEISAKINDMLRTPIENSDIKFVVEDASRQTYSTLGEVCSTPRTSCPPKYSTLGEVYSTPQIPCPSKCRASGEALAISMVGKLSTVSLELRDHHGTETEDPIAMVHGELRSCTDSSAIDCNVEKSQKNTYTITYKPARKGKHQLHITVNRAHVQGSPFDVVALRPFATPLRMITGLKHPWGIAVDPVGSLFVAESKGKQIAVVTPGEERSRITGGKQLFKREFEQPVGIALDTDCNLMVTDVSYSNVQLYTSKGTLLKSVGNVGAKELQFTYPVGIKRNASNGKIYVTECETNHRVQILNPDLSYHKKFGTKGSGKGQFASPSDVAFDREGNVYVVDSDNHRIEVFTADGRYLREFGRRGTKEGRLCLPSSICIDSDDMVYVTEVENHRVSIFSKEGHFVKSFGSRGNQPGQFCHPHGIAADAEGFLYISDSDNDRVQVF